MSASSVTSLDERLPEITIDMTGAESGSNFSIMGESVPAGSVESRAETLALTSSEATSIFFSSTKVAKTCDCPSIVVERSSSMPLIVFTASSMGLVIWLSISSGLAPSRRVETVMVGRSTLGNRSRPSSL